MLEKNPEDRPTIREVFDILKGTKASDSVTSSGPIIGDDVMPEFIKKPELRSTFKKKETEVLPEEKNVKSNLRSKTWNVN